MVTDLKATRSNRTNTHEEIDSLIAMAEKQTNNSKTSGQKNRAKPMPHNDVKVSVRVTMD